MSTLLIPFRLSSLFFSYDKYKMKEHPFFLFKRKMTLIAERLLAARFCNAIAHFIHTECFLSLGIKHNACMAAGQFEALSSRPSGQCVFEISAKGHVQIMRMLAFCRCSFDWNQVLSGASYGGHLQCIHLAINKGASSWNCGLYEACQGGHRDVAEFMISKGANDRNWALYGACESGHRDLAEWMISKGADDWDCALYGACQGGHRKIAEWMITKGANNWNRGLYHACKSDHVHIASLMIQKGATKCEACWKPMSEHV
jgi:hypothetical protein